MFQILGRARHWSLFHLISCQMFFRSIYQTGWLYRL